MTTGNQAFQRSVNLALVMRAIRDSSPVSRTEIAQVTGLTKSTVTNLVRDLADRGLVVERPVSQTAPRGGRPRVGLAIAPESARIAGVDLRPDGVRVVERDLSGHLLCKSSQDAGPRRLTMRESWDLATGLFAAASPTPAPLLGVGIALPATVDSIRGTVILSRSFGIRVAPIGELLGESTTSLVIENDANALAWGALASPEPLERPCLIAVIGRAEQDAGSARMRVGTGIVIDGRVYHGRNNEAGEFRSARWRDGIELELAQPGEDGIVELLESLAVVVSMLRPQRLVYGGDLADQEALIDQVLAGRLVGSYVDPRVSGCPVVPAALGPLAVADGACRMYLERLFAVPSIELDRPSGVPGWEAIDLSRVASGS